MDGNPTLRGMLGEVGLKSETRWSPEVAVGGDDDDGGGCCCVASGGVTSIMGLTVDSAICDDAVVDGGAKT